MTMLEGVRTDGRTEAAFRRGYHQGVQGLLQALEGAVPQETLDRLKGWSEGELESWRLSPTTGRESLPAPPKL